MLFGLFGCNKYETIDQRVSKNFVKNKDGALFYKSVSSSSWRVDYFPVSTNHPKSFKPLSEVYAKDKNTAFFKWHPLPKAKATTFRVDKNYPNLFSTDGQFVFYEKYLLENFVANDFKSHSRNYISNSEKVLLVNKNQFKGQEYSIYDVPVTDINSFRIVETMDGKKEHILGGLAKDKNWLYVNNIRLTIPSKNAVVLSGGFPATIVSEDKLYLLFEGEQNTNFLSKNLPAHLSFMDYGKIANFEYHEYHLFEIEGFSNIKIFSDKWFQDKTGVYYIQGSKIFLASTDTKKQYQLHQDFGNALRYNEGYLVYYFVDQNLPFFYHFSDKALFLTRDVVKDQGKVFHRAKEIPFVDYETFVLVDQTHFMDKNYYYYASFNTHPQPLPEGAYAKIKSGEATWQDYFGVKSNRNETIYQDYWNGFGIKHQMSRNWQEEQFVIHLKNQATKSTRLDKALENELEFYFKVYIEENEKQSYIPFEPKITVFQDYDYQNILPNQEIIIEYQFTAEQKKQVASFLPKGAVSTYIGIFITRGGTEQKSPDDFYLETSLLINQDY